MFKPLPMLTPLFWGDHCSGLWYQSLDISDKKKNRIILPPEPVNYPGSFRSLLNGVIGQEQGYENRNAYDMKPVTQRIPPIRNTMDLMFATQNRQAQQVEPIVLAKKQTTHASGVDSTSRRWCIKAGYCQGTKEFGFALGWRCDGLRCIFSHSPTGDWNCGQGRHKNCCTARWICARCGFHWICETHNMAMGLRA